MIPPQAIRDVLAALRSGSHRYMAIRPADATPANAPGIIVPGRSAADLAYACDGAGEQWPHCQAWCLIGSDEQLAEIGDDWPPGMRALQMPVTLANFSTQYGSAGTE
jgi:hypothetical protein